MKKWDIISSDNGLVVYGYVVYGGKVHGNSFS